MNGNRWVRQFHRWVSVAFTLTVILNFALMGQGEETRMQVAYLPLLPLALLFFTGVYLFVVPYLAKRRGVVGTE